MLTTQKTWWSLSRLPTQIEQDIRQTECVAISNVHTLRSSTFCVYSVILRNSLPTAQPQHYTRARFLTPLSNRFMQLAGLGD